MLLSVLAIAAATGAPAAAQKKDAAQKKATARGWTAYDRPAEYGTVHERDVKVTMSDGTVIAADVIRPDAPGRFPVLLQQTPYNKQLIGPTGGFDWFAERGYAVVIADVRGTGGSGGTWGAFDEREQRDGAELVEWAAAQPFSDGKVGLFGGSYMGLNQLLTAAQRPKGLRAIFPVVPMADGYRDIVFSGGQINSGFIPLWLGLVTAGSLAPPADALSGDPQDLVRAATTLLAHAGGALDFQLGMLVSAIAGGDTTFDGPFWKMRSPLEVVDRIDVPAFVVGGHHDLFQRGEPLIYERLKRRVTARLVMGPWTHVQAGQGLPADGLPTTLSALQLRWFDRWLKGVDTRVAAIPKVTQYVLGAGRYETRQDWPDPRLQPKRLHLRAQNRLTTARPDTTEPTDRFVQQPLSGICTRSTDQWTAGLGSAIPCTRDGRLDETTGVSYTSEPLERDLRLDGPILANLFVRTTTRDAVVTVRVHDVAPDGTPTELTAGWLAASFREVDRERSRFVRGRLLQPWHPFTRESAKPLAPGEIAEMPVEVFPTSAVIRRGHRLKVSVTPGDFPHAIPPLPQLLDGLGGRVEILHDPGHPSSVVLPRVGARCPGQKGAGTKRCKPLPVPRLIRG
jgi:hypothetical protein